MASADKDKEAPEAVAATETAEGEESAVAASAKGGKSKLLIIAAAALLLLGGGGGAAWFFFLRAPASASHDQKAEPVTAEELVDVAEMTVNLRTSDGGAKTLRVHLMLVPGDKKKEEITAALPLVIDAFQPFLRELRPEDIAGSAATFRIKEEMLVRANAVLGPKSVRDVLIQDLVQQ
ncbi:flagellar basal body-associated FliL family protein [Sphingomonas sp. KRR8]|uniref:flagellar basal body-associated FliL family protein n=1 Tax=Sphingomonas sp. KRR8 TaxID=2942996 RepID=UPI002021B9C0|nr:flagellar basal body-associated FliL family protein [Sphingomonas sp. KRR8]URD61379.1 flagellar basal body-associated FliL family protein [Sphingomonas sp. KRR8]